MEWIKDRLEFRLSIPFGLSKMMSWLLNAYSMPNLKTNPYLSYPPDLCQCHWFPDTRQLQNCLLHRPDATLCYRPETGGVHLQCK